MGSLELLSSFKFQVSGFMIIDKKLFDELSAQAKASPRLRQAYDLRNTPEDNRGKVHFDFALQGGGNAKRNILEPGTVMPNYICVDSCSNISLFYF